MVLMRAHDVPEGQQRSVVFEARVMQVESLGQQKEDGKPDPAQAS
jgi:hypothetical protein